MEDKKSNTLKWVLVGVLAVLAIAVVFTAPAMASATSSDPFKGAWKATDRDGSAMTLAISGGGAKRHITWFDQYWNCQNCNPPGYYPTVALGSGEVKDDKLSATLRWHDAPPGDWTEEFPHEWIAQSDGTLSDGTFTWYRAGN